MRSDDEKLVSQTLAGDRDAFGVLVHKYQEMVYAYAFQKVRNEADAQDITQEVFWRAYHHLYQLRRPHRFRSWLYTIMANQCKRQLMNVTKTRQRETALADATDDALRIEPAHAVPTEGWRVDLEQALTELPDDNRVAVSMFYMGDHSLKEISEFLGVSVNTVKSKLYRARQQLGSALSERYGSFLKSHKLKGGFLMQFMEQIRHVPSPTMALSWSGTAIGKIAFSLIMAVCVFIGIARHGTDSPTIPPMKRVGAGPTEVVLLGPTVNSTRSSIPIVPVQTENRPPAGSSRTSGDRGHQLTARRASLGRGGGVQQPAGAVWGRFQTLTFSGRVVDNNGVPVADAELRYAIRSYPLEGDAESGYSTYPDPKYVTRTERNGTFRFKFSPSERRWMHFESKKVLNRLHLAVIHPDHAIWWQEFPFQSTTDIEIQLEIPGIISGKVMNEAGEPIQNAEILMNSLFHGDPMLRESEDNLMPDALPQPVKTDANGEFVLRGLPQGATTNFDVQGPGYAKQNRYGVRVGTEGLEFQLKRESRVEGRLTYAGTGKPVKNAGVVLEGGQPTHGWRYVHVDANGNYFLTNLAAGTYSLYLNYGPKGWTAIAKEFITIPEGQTVSNVDLTLIRSGFITGRVTDRDTNKPIANHRIRLKDAARPEGSQLRDHRTKTDKTGVYRFDAAPGRALVHTNPPVGYQGFGRTGALNIGQIQRRVEVVEGETVVVDFQFSRGVELAGRLFTKTGEPVAGASIANVQDWHTEYGRSDESGGFTIGGLRPGQRLGLKAEHGELGLRGTIEIVVRPWLPIDIRMKPYERVKVSGRVIDPEGKPMPSMKVHLTRWHLYGGYGTDVAVTGDDGWFRGIELIVGDKYTISVEAEGYREATTDQFTATAEMTQIADLVLLPAGGQFFIEGRVTDTSGEPVRAARLGISQGGQHWLRYTDENGNYRFEDLSMTVILTLYIHHPGYTEHEFNILKTNQRHDLVLVKADGYLAGKVVDTDGKPIVEQVRVRITAKEDPSSGYRYSPSALTNPQGEFELKHIKDPIVSIIVSDETGFNFFKFFENIPVNQGDLILTLSPPKSSPGLTPEQLAERLYSQACKERSKTLVNQPAPELGVAEWLYGSPISIEGLKGKTVALHFWRSAGFDLHQVSMLNVLQEVYQEKGLVCITICPASTVVETVKRYIAEQSVSHPIALDQPTTVVGAEGETFDRYAIGWSTPFVLINTAGEITGHIRDDELEDQIQILLAD